MDIGLNEEDNRIGKCLCECYKLSLDNKNEIFELFS